MIDWQPNPIAVLDNVKGALRRKILRKAINRGVKILRTPLKAAVPSESGALGKSIGQKVYTSRRKAVVGVVGARTAIQATFRGRVRVPAKYLQLIDKGTAERQTKAGHRTGRVIGRNFMDRVYSAHVNQAIGAMRQVTAEELHNEMLKAGRS
jgi:hypothetical protein